MSRFTTQVRYICESALGIEESQGFNNIVKTANDAVPLIFNFDFPLFDESYRQQFCANILLHHWTREISDETPALWKLRLYNKLNQIMPYYNQLYKSQLLEFNPLYEIDLKKDWTKTIDGDTGNITTITGSNGGTSSLSETTDKDESINIDTNNTINTNTEKDIITTEHKEIESSVNEDVKNKNTSKTDTDTTGENTTVVADKKVNKFSNTPQGALTNVENDTYLTSATIDNVDNNTENNSRVESTVNGTSEDINSKDIITNNEETSNSNVSDDTSENMVSTYDSTAITDGRTVKTGTNNFNSSNSSNTSQTGTINNIETYFEHVYGKQSNSSYSKLLTEFRETFLNIDLMIDNELKELFYGVYDVW